MLSTDAPHQGEAVAFWSRQRRLSMPARGSGNSLHPNFWGAEEKRVFCSQEAAMNGARNVCTLEALQAEGDSQDSVKIFRLTLQNDLPGERSEQTKQKPVGRAFAMVANRPTSSHTLASEFIKSNSGDEEIIKVYLRARAEDTVKQAKSLHQSKDESGHLQELPLEKTNGIRPHRTTSYRNMSVSQQDESTDPREDISVMRETTKKFFSKLQEAEKRHQSDRAAYETSISHYRREAEQSGMALKKAEQELQGKDLKLDELQRLLTGMEKEHQTLLQKMKEGEAELEQLRSAERDKLEEQERSAKLEKEVSILKEKIHHLDDMLKSQQRKVRQMIEQLQNSKTVIQSKDVIIQELKERVAYLEAENLEMHDRMEHLIEKQANPGALSTRSRSKSEVVSSKRLTKALGPKPLPLIRVVET